MTATIYANRSDIPATILGAFPEYCGNKFKITATDSVTLCDLNYSGGTRNQYRAVDIATGKVLDGSAANRPPPWSNTSEGQEVKIPEGIAVVEHSMFCGKNHGLTIYARVSSLAPLLTAPKDLPWAELVVLYATRCYKNTYAGKSDCQFNKATHETGIGAFQWANAKVRLIGSKHLTKAGAITNRGRNAVSHLHSFPKESKT